MYFYAQLLFCHYVPLVLIGEFKSMSISYLIKISFSLLRLSKFHCAIAKTSKKITGKFFISETFFTRIFFQKILRKFFFSWIFFQGNFFPRNLFLLDVFPNFLRRISFEEIFFGYFVCWNKLQIIMKLIFLENIFL